MVKLGTIVAWLMIVSGTVKTAMGYFVAFNFDQEQNAAAARRYLAAANSGEAINEGMIIFVAGVAVGLLAKIAKKRSASKYPYLGALSLNHSLY